MRAAIASAVLAALCWGAAVAQPAEHNPAAGIDAVFAAFSSRSPGCAVGVSKDGNPIFSKGYGMADLEHGVPITSKTMFYMASVSKQFTAMSVLMLAKENKLSLDDSVRKYVPELPRYADKITIYNLLTHTSGIRDYLTLGELSGLSDDNAYNETEVLQQLSRQAGLNFQSGTAMLYSNSGYVLLSIIVNRVTGKPLNEVSRTFIFNPLGMTASLFQHDHSGLVANKAFGYVLRSGAWHASNNMLDHVGDGGLYSSVDDMFHWMGNFDAPKVGADALGVMETPATLRNGKKTAYGMGLSLSAYRGLKVVEHNGAYAGYRTEDLWFPSERLSVIVLCNLGVVDPPQLARKISDFYLLDRGQLSPPPAPPAYKAEVAVDPKLLDMYVGDYQLGPGLVMSFTRDRDHLVTRSTGQRPAPMFAVSNTAFRMQAQPAEVVFENPSDGGKAQGAVMLQNGASLPMTRIVIPKPSTDQLRAYEGKFYSAELDVTYEVLDRNGVLTLRYPRGDIDLEPVGKDVFAGASVGNLKFVCAGGGKCNALSVDDGRALHLRFFRVATTRPAAKPRG